MRIACLLLAAGDSTRMGGRNKLLLEVEGRPLVRRTLEEIAKISFSEVVVVTGHESGQIESALRGLPAKFTHNPAHQSGMHSSIRAGLLALADECDAFFVCLADQPYFDHRNLLKSIAAIDGDREGGVFVPVHEGTWGQPVLISSRYIPEILAHTDGDHGCSYLFKRHPDALRLVEVSRAVLVDVDEPRDYEKLSAPQDPVLQLHEKAMELRRSARPYAVATVIEIMGSASARTGSKALFDEMGRNVLGWVGGGCAERFVGEEAVAAMKEGHTRIVLADLDDEIFGLGVACGGKMRVFIEPVLPAEEISLPNAPKWEREIAGLSGHYGWAVKPSGEKAPGTIEELLLTMTDAVASKRGRTAKSLREVKPVPARFAKPESLRPKSVTIVGRTRITEALARHFHMLSYDVRAIGPGLKKEDYPSTIECKCLDDGYEIDFREGDVVVIASHTAQDSELVKAALEAKASHVAMVGSLKRSDEVLSHLGWKDSQVEAPLFVPAGLDIDARNPDEIALSIVAEVLKRAEARA